VHGRMGPALSQRGRNSALHTCLYRAPALPMRRPRPEQGEQLTPAIVNATERAIVTIGKRDPDRVNARAARKLALRDQG
jgi:hypothetical protein